MKTLLGFLIAAVLAAVVSVGCANNGKVSSADRDIVLNDTLMRSELIKMDVLTQHNVVAGLSPEKKVELYDYKLQKDLESGKLSDAEAALLKDLRSHLSVKIYSDKQAGDEFRAYSKKIEDKLRNDYGWDDEKMFKYTETVMTAEEAEPVIRAKKKMMQ